MDKKLIQQLTEYGQNLSTVGVNEIAIANVIALVITELQQKPVPEAYMGYALYDSDSTLYEQGKVILSKKARNKHEELIKKIAVPKDGYIETYLVNETSDDVWFDQFRILSTGPLIVQETHYDPWGVELSGLGYQYGGIKVNPYLYNGKEANGHLGVNLYDFGARLYDPAIGRWFVSDPMAEKMRRHSPYNYAFNNPLRYIDPDGMEPYEVMGAVTTSGESMSQEDETQKSVVNEEEVMIDTGYGQMVSSRDLLGGVDYAGNFETAKNNKAESPFTLHSNSVSSKPFTGSMRDRSTYFEGVRVYTTEVGDIGRGAAGTLPGVGIFVNPNDKFNKDLLRHEFGHILQARKWGMDFFYGTIVSESIKSANRANEINDPSKYNHHDSWTEWTANFLSWHYFGKPSNWNPSYQLYPSNIRSGSLQPMLPSKLFIDLEKKK
ncbi:RHS repeat-associated core domain-containing protein [Algoriphagus aquimarinus]|uniref:RHS repeat-associated core domain-containing protein n=2 Tax=Algoriphagus aquimarinus TaxID=237018 RepID=A0A5C7AA07_9BACT|nr:RHS repeat-associated core domain-containing protein [Algoriphagus aquimarinus]